MDLDEQSSSLQNQSMFPSISEDIKKSKLIAHPCKDSSLKNAASKKSTASKIKTVNNSLRKQNTIVKLYLSFEDFRKQIHRKNLFSMDSWFLKNQSIDKLLGPSERTAMRRNRYRVVMDADDGRRRREVNMIEIWKNKRKKSLFTKRNETLQLHHQTSNVSQVEILLWFSIYKVENL
ncbi:hypothetical protein LIER_18664 [Lithospermum erythrorhizon]|uniref:IBB domain-containing protein n=1 Tax=Lithospermum erythrorhizon TaxID=34254 RepID=A0AAV3QET7_LITER